MRKKTNYYSFLNPFFWLVLGFLSLHSRPVLSNELELSPEIIDNSPVLQRWLEKVPDVLEDIKNKPRFSSRFRLGYFQLSDDNQSGWLLNVEDLGINKGRLTFSADYQDSFSGEYQNLGVRVQYYLLPLGRHVNIAPVLGYRYFQVEDYSINAVNIGAKLVLVLSSQGGADIFVTQNFLLSGDGQQVGITTVSFGYSINSKLRISTDIEKQNSIVVKDTRWSLVIELLGFN